MSRTRMIIPTSLPGTARYNGVSLSRSYSRGDFHRCTDEVLPGNGHPLEIVHTTSSGGLLNGTNGLTGMKERTYQNYCLQAVTSYFSLLQWPLDKALGLSSDAAYASKLLAMTNPSRPDVDIPVFIAELKDLPSLVYKEGGKLLRRIAKYNLKYQFGVRPLVSDLLAMLDWVALVEKRKKELEQLGKSGLRRRRALDRGALVEKLFINYNSDAGVVVLNHATSRETTAEVSGFVKWFPTSGFPATDASLLSSARRAVLGLTVDGATAWELIPFSWLIDWYGSVGTYLMASRNVVPCSHSKPQIMRHSKQKVKSKDISFSDGWLTCSPYQLKAEKKTRTLASATPFTARLPALSARQLSILASLVIVKAGKY